MRLQAKAEGDAETGHRRVKWPGMTPEREREVELEDGTKIPLGPGSIDLAEDLTGKGHITRVVGNEPRITLAIPVAE